jgi:hypothetical protein
MTSGEIVGGELRRHPTPAERQAGAEHRYLCTRAAKRTQDVWQHARHAQADEHERDRQRLTGVMGVAWGGRQRGADHAEHDRRHREILVASRVLVQHPLREEQQYEQSGGQRRLDDHQRSQQQSDHLQGPAQNRESSAEQPANTSDQTPDQR